MNRPHTSAGHSVRKCSAISARNFSPTSIRFFAPTPFDAATTRVRCPDIRAAI
jgi:hypothetical protein